MQPTYNDTMKVINICEKIILNSPNHPNIDLLTGLLEHAYQAVEDVNYEHIRDIVHALLDIGYIDEKTFN